MDRTNNLRVSAPRHIHCRHCTENVTPHKAHGVSLGVDAEGEGLRWVGARWQSRGGSNRTVNESRMTAFQQATRDKASSKGLACADSLYLLRHFMLTVIGSGS